MCNPYQTCPKKEFLSRMEYMPKFVSSCSGKYKIHFMMFWTAFNID